MSEFVHLHLHTEYSLLDGACRIADIPARVKECGHTACAITDHGVMYGAVAFYEACKKADIQPIIGCEVYLARRTRFDRVGDEDSHSYHLVLLCKNEVGYRNLIKMVTKSFTEGFYRKPRVDFGLLEEYHEGLVALSACLSGAVSTALQNGDYDTAKEHAMKMRDIFGDDYYLELQDHGMDIQKQVNRGIVRLSRELSIPMVATNDAHYLRRSDAENQAILMCVQTGSVIADGNPLGFETDEFYYKTTEEMESLFGYLSNEATGSPIANTVAVAGKCRFDFDFSKLYLPTYHPEDGSDPEDYLSRLAYLGFDSRVASGRIVFTDRHPESEYRERIAYELSVINQMGYAEYFLIVQDFVGWAKRQKIPVGPGRGSGAGSLVAFLLGITDLDPLLFDLLFERFLNPERVSMPDFDIDFCYNRRDEVIGYVRKRYGEDHVSQIVTFGTLAARAAVKDVGRVLGMSYSDTDAVAKCIPHELNMTLDNALASSKELRAMYDSNPQVKRLIDVSRALEGMPRHSSTHAAGVVITDKPVSDYVPLAVSGDMTVTQFDMDTVAKLGLLKFDFLALRYLTIIDDTERQIREYEPDFSVDMLPLDDKKTYDMISQGNTDGVFQLESGGMRQMLTNLRPDRMDDIIAAISLYRPGPMDSIPKYIENRHDPSKIHYAVPEIAPILDVTNGCMVYQEQVMQVCRVAAGYSLGRADLVRRMMAKKKTADMEKEREVFVKGANDNGISTENANALFDEMSSFASYAFNKSHAAAYALLAYRTAYLKCHYPCEYLAALMTSVIGNTVKTAGYIAECHRCHIAILPPDINESTSYFHAGYRTVTGGQREGYIQFGLLALKNLGEGFTNRLLSERKNGKFTSFDDFLERMYAKDMNKRQVEAFIKVGVFDNMGVKRSQLLQVYSQRMDDIQEKKRNNLSGQLDLFSQFGDGETADTGLKYPDLPELSFRERLRFEKEAAGICFSGHLLDDYREAVDKVQSVSVGSILLAFDEEAESNVTFTDKQTVTVCAIVTQVQVKMTKNGKQMAFATVEDNTGEIEVVIFAKIFEKYGMYFTEEAALTIVGQLSVREEEAPRLLLQSATPLTDNAGQTVDVQSVAVSEKPESDTKEVSEESVDGKKTDIGNGYHKGTPPDIPMQYIHGGVASDIPSPPDRISGDRTIQNTVPRKIYLRVDSPDSIGYRKALNLAYIFGEGATEVIFYDKSTSTYQKQSDVRLYASPFVLKELRELLGDENVVVK